VPVAGYSSLFTYCTQALHLSEHAAYGRIETARAARRFPVLMDLLADGSLNVTTVGLLAPHLTADNHRRVLEIHHVVPFAAGGETVVDNLQLRCRAHNAYEAEEFFGPMAVSETQMPYSVRTELIALAAEFSSRNVEFSQPLKDDDDGLRGFELKDADGYVLFFGRPRP
jgi:hypothetical protein